MCVHTDWALILHIFDVFAGAEHLSLIRKRDNLHCYGTVEFQFYIPFYGTALRRCNSHTIKLTHSSIGFHGFQYSQRYATVTTTNFGKFQSPEQAGHTCQWSPPLSTALGSRSSTLSLQVLSFRKFQTDRTIPMCVFCVLVFLHLAYFEGSPVSQHRSACCLFMRLHNIPVNGYTIFYYTFLIC